MWNWWWNKVALGQVFLRVLRFPLQSSFAPPITPQSPSCIIRWMHNRPMWPQCWDLYEPRGLETKRPKEPEPRGPEEWTYRGLKSHPTKKSGQAVQLVMWHKLFIVSLGNRIPIMKGNIIPVLNYVIKHMPWRHMEEWRYSSTILALGIRWRWWSASRFCSFTHGNVVLRIHCIGNYGKR
jgi:hypothetical protein